MPSADTLLVEVNREVGEKLIKEGKAKPVKLPTAADAKRTKKQKQNESSAHPLEEFFGIWAESPASLDQVRKDQWERK